ncbi:MAG: hypothetical protein M3Q07_27655 [Pseudobdellovibrionaceae bacterium]|nr:hypothetical protein [Pseudobdellovibrionaceae bacterium]
MTRRLQSTFIAFKSRRLLLERCRAFFEFGFSIVQSRFELVDILPVLSQSLIVDIQGCFMFN